MNNADTDLRISSANRGTKITLQVDGVPCTAYEGETVHAALLAEGIRVLRIAGKTGEPRGIFCGMGICYECRVTINGVPDQLACMTLATDGMQIETR
ncbi:(2Fe-2S)-binding protein [Desulfotignum balticum]|uniref:(2Fe-2S)-binding protein n=1 Tax=Desulfotignum balticum TaxID=115781 RepID=UPI0004034067|nr:(2Fe-2S)-binding protein [Desulfotignum balticum]